MPRKILLEAAFLTRVVRAVTRRHGAHCYSHSTRHQSLSLSPPTIIYSDNHILVVNKPPGWHSVPNLYEEQQQQQHQQQHQHEHQSSHKVAPATVENDENSDTTIRNSKCLLTFLQDKQWGGGSTKTFLKPLHRIDQPCSGLLMLAKTSKAASRIAKVWKQKEVEKSYLCVISASRLESLRRHSSLITRSVPPSYENGTAASTANYNNHQHRHEWWKIQGYQHRRLSPPHDHRPLQESQSSSATTNSARAVVGWNVKITPEDPAPLDNARLVAAEWRHLALSTATGTTTATKSRQQRTDNRNRSDTDDKLDVILVRTNSGARHMVRALMAQIGHCPIHGDRRYGSSKQQTGSPNDFRRTVGLHAFSIQLPDQLKLGSTQQRYFEAPIPAAWEYAANPSITQYMVQEALMLDDF